MGGSMARLRYAQYLESLPLGTLRIIGREKGVPHSSARKKNDLIDAIIDVLTGEVPPAPISNKGAPVKQGYLAPEVSRRLEEIRRGLEQDRVLTVHCDDEEEETPLKRKVYAGYLELSAGGGGYLRSSLASLESKAFVSAATVRDYGLREGDYVNGTARKEEGGAVLTELLGVNGMVTGGFSTRLSFEKTTPRYPDSRYRFEYAQGDNSLRVIDLFAPIGRGQRALVCCDAGVERIEFLTQIALALEGNYPSEVVVIALLFDASPEAVVEMEEKVSYVKVAGCSFEESAERQVRTAKLALEHAKRLAEVGRDVVLLVDSLTRLSRLCEKTETSFDVKKFFATARNTQEAGSVTVIATLLSEMHSGADELLGMENCKITLKEGITSGAGVPMPAIHASKTYRQEALLSQEEVAFARAMRANEFGSEVDLLRLFEKTESNAALIAYAKINE